MRHPDVSTPGQLPGGGAPGCFLPPSLVSCPGHWEAQRRKQPPCSRPSWASCLQPGATSLTLSRAPPLTLRGFFYILGSGSSFSAAGLVQGSGPLTLPHLPHLTHPNPPKNSSKDQQRRLGPHLMGQTTESPLTPASDTHTLQAPAGSLHIREAHGTAGKPANEERWNDPRTPPLLFQSGHPWVTGPPTHRQPCSCPHPHAVPLPPSPPLMAVEVGPQALSSGPCCHLLSGPFTSRLSSTTVT